MTWAEIRDAFVTIRTEMELNQVAVSERGQLPQSAVSKIENNYDLGPTVGTFVRALSGLGLTPSEFFARIEHPGTNRQETTGYTVPAMVESAPSSSEEGTDRDAALVASRDPVAALRSDIDALRGAIAARLDDIQTRLTTAEQQARRADAFVTAEKDRRNRRNASARGKTPRAIR